MCSPGTFVSVGTLRPQLLSASLGLLTDAVICGQDGDCVTALVWLAKLRPGDSRATSWMFPATMIGGGVIPPAIGVAIGWLGIAWAPAVLAAVAAVTLAAFLLAGMRGREYQQSGPNSN